MAVRAKVPPAACVAGWLKVMVCAAVEMTKDLVILVAAVNLLLPPWVAVTVQVPAPRAVKVFPETEHTVKGLAEKVTAKPDDALALKVELAPTLSGSG